MEATILRQDTDNCLVQWSSEQGFGQLNIRRTTGCTYVVDAECMSIGHVIEVIKALK
jgi:hypothetical protein